MIGDLEIVGEITLSGNDIPFETNSDDGNRHRSITLIFLLLQRCAGIIW